jgi:hypothetical protein
MAGFSAPTGCRGRSSGPPPVRVIPFTRGQSPVPGEQRRRGHREHLGPPAPGDQPGQCRKPQPVGRLVADPAGLAAQHRVLVPEHQELGVLGHLTPGQHHQTAEQTANEQVDDREDHSAMISTRLAAQARSSNRAPQDPAGAVSSCACTYGPQAWANAERSHRRAMRFPGQRLGLRAASSADDGLRQLRIAPGEGWGQRAQGCLTKVARV